MIDLVLVHPPVALPCEPPVGAGVLAAALRGHGVTVEVVDANVEALEALLGSVGAGVASTTAERRAVRARSRALLQLRSAAAYAVLDRYRAAVRDLTQLLQLAARPAARVGLADYHEAGRSPLRSADLRAAAAAPEESPYCATFVVLGERIAALRPRRIGISLNYLHQALPAMALAGVLRRRLPDVPLLLGGALVGCWRGRLAPDALRPTVARLVFGDGVAPLLEELALPVADAGRSAVTAPDYVGVPWDRYLAPRRIAPVATSRGCVWGRCRYCPEAALGEPFVALPAEEIGTALDAVRRRSEAELLHVTDSAISLPTLLALARQRWSARWYGFTRFYRELADAEVCRELRRSGCLMLQLGLESGSPRVLTRLRKGIPLELVGHTLRQLADAGIGVYLYVMFGVPGETRDDALQTTELVASCAEQIGYLNTSLLNLPVCSPQEPDLRRAPFGDDVEGYTEEANDLTLYSGFVAATGWDRRAARRFLEREFARHPQVSPILRRTPPVFGANHAPFFQPW